MRPLTWDEYYEKFDTWSESTRAQYVSRLSTVGDHDQVAAIANCLYNQSASVSPEVLQMAKNTIDLRAARRQQKKANREAFWTGAAQTMLIDSLIDDLFKKKD